MSTMIVPRYNIVMTYDLDPLQEEDFYRFALGEFVPSMQNMGLYLVRAWHTAYGAYPLRQSEFVAENLETVREALASEDFKALEDKLLSFVTNYDRRVVQFSDGFQFVPN
jgi:hypothetical protein